MGFRFHKMEGTGNDFVVVYRSALPPEASPDLARALCDRHTGVGADGVLVVGEPDDRRVGSMTVWNADGSVAEMCGNGLRCVAVRLLEDGAWASGTSRLLGTGAGDVVATRTDRGIRVDLGRPRPAASPRAVTTVDGTVLGVDVDMGNPHFVVFSDDAPATDLTVWGPHLATHHSFTEGTNVEHVAVHAGALRMRVWERGVGETLACGSGACAAFVAARVTGRLASEAADVHLPGGVLRVHWVDENVSLEGPARTVFEGVWPHHEERR